MSFISYFNINENNTLAGLWSINIYINMENNTKTQLCLLCLTLSIYTPCTLEEIYSKTNNDAILFPLSISSVQYVYVMFPLTHWGRVTLICVSELTIIGSDNGLLPGRRQPIIWTNTGILLTGPSGTNFSEILIAILTFSFKKMCLKVSSAKWQPFCLGLNVLRQASKPANNGMYRYHSRCWCIFDAIIKAISWFYAWDTFWHMTRSLVILNNQLNNQSTCQWNTVYPIKYNTVL